MDKDLIYKNKIYSKDTCFLIPNILNIQLAGSTKFGCTLRKYDKKWYVRISIDKKSKSFGAYKDVKTARSVYIKNKAIELLKLIDQWCYKGLLDERTEYYLIKYVTEYEEVMLSEI